MEISEEVARKVLATVDAGLVSGIGHPTPGQMCVEAAVCYAMGLPHSDRPACVSNALRGLKIRLNDSDWSSKEARAKGMRRLAIAQLGSAGVLDDKEFSRRVYDIVVGKYVPIAFRFAASAHPDKKHKDALETAAKSVETEKTIKALFAARKIARAADAAADAAAYSATAYAAGTADAAAYAAANAAATADAAYAASAANAATAAFADAARDKVLSEFAEDVVTILIDMNAPGCQWLWMTETPVAEPVP